MSSFQESFASTESEFVTVRHKKSSKKSKFQPLKPLADNTVEKPFKINIVENLPSESHSSKDVPIASAAAFDTRSDNASTSTRPRGPRRPPSGIFVNLESKWKKFVRDLIPNKSSRTSDKTVMEQISKVKTNPDVSYFEFKKIVCMIFHQALKTDRNTLVDEIIKYWNKNKYPIVELIDSTCDDCKPMTQACWSGSIYCIQRLISVDLSGAVLYTIHAKKNETILKTLEQGKLNAMKNPDSALFTKDRFEKCEKFIREAIERLESSKKSASRDGEEEQISSEIKESIDGIIESSESIVDQLVLKLVDLYLEDQAKSSEYFKAVKTIVEADVFNQIDSRLKNEGIELVA